MLPFSKARKIAEAWVAIMTDGKAELVHDSVQAKPYGWMFFYQSSAHLRDPSNMLTALAGNAPFIVDRVNGEIHVLGTAPAIFEKRLSDYERTLPDAVLRSIPEQPVW